MTSSTRIQHFRLYLCCIIYNFYIKPSTEASTEFFRNGFHMVCSWMTSCTVCGKFSHSQALWNNTNSAVWREMQQRADSMSDSFCIANKSNANFYTCSFTQNAHALGSCAEAILDIVTSWSEGSSPDITTFLRVLLWVKDLSGGLIPSVIHSSRALRRREINITKEARDGQLPFSHRPLVDGLAVWKKGSNSPSHWRRRWMNVKNSRENTGVPHLLLSSTITNLFSCHVPKIQSRSARSIMLDGSQRELHKSHKYFPNWEAYVFTQHHLYIWGTFTVVIKSLKGNETTFKRSEPAFEASRSLGKPCHADISVCLKTQQQHLSVEGMFPSLRTQHRSHCEDFWLGLFRQQKIVLMRSA